VAWPVSLGPNLVTWNKLPNGIHKDTPFLNIDDATISSQTFNDNIFTSTNYFNKLRGGKIILKLKSSKKVVNGILLEINGNFVTISNSSGVFSYNRSELEYLAKEDKSNHIPNFNPFLSWNLHSKSNKTIKGELVYKSNNFAWNTIYRLKMINEEKGELIAEAVISNTSDMAFNHAKIQLVEGHLNQPNGKSPKTERMNRPAMALDRSTMPMMGKDELGDYHIYTLNDNQNLEAKENITVRMYGPLDVGYTKTYVFENSERRQKEEPLEVRLEMENKESNGLGISLPGGKVEIYSYTKSGGLEYIGADNMGQIPKGQSTSFTSGRAFDVIGKRKVLNYNRERKSEEAVIEIRVINARTEKVNVQLIEHINGDWVIKHESINYQKKDASTIMFPFLLNPGETKNVTYTYRKEWK